MAIELKNLDTGEVQYRIEAPTLQGVRLQNADLRRVSLAGMDLRGANLQSARLKGALLAGANLQGANLARADLRSAHAHGALLDGTDLTHAQLDSAELSGASFRRATLTGTNLSYANLRDARLAQANLTEANLHGADLRDADLSEVIGLSSALCSDVLHSQGTRWPQRSTSSEVADDPAGSPFEGEGVSERDRLKSRVAAWIAAAAVVCAFLVLDFFVPGLTFQAGNEWVAMIAMGICFGQVSLIATWAALAPGNVVLRLPWSLLLGMFMWYSLVLGNLMIQQYSSFYRFDLDAAILLGVILLGGVVVAQIPLWIAGQAFGGRLVGPAGGPGETAPGRLQFEIWHMLLGTALVAVALAPLRTVLPPGDFDRLDLQGEAVVVLFVVALSSLLVAVPCIWGAFRKIEQLVGLALLWLFYCFLLTAIEFAVLCVAYGDSPPDGGEVVGMMYTLNVSQCATVFGTLLVFRGLGFRLLRLPAIDRPTSGPDIAKGES